MPRRKRQLLDDDESDSSAASENGDFEVQSNDPDTQEERALFENPYRHKKRRRNGKEDALYGVFGKDSEDEGHSGGPRRGQKGGNDWTKAPAFVSGEKVNLKESVDGEDDGEGDVESVIESDDDEGTSGGENENELHESGSSRPPSPRIREEEDDESPTRIGGLGSRAEPRLTEISSGVLKGGTGIGFKRDNDSSIHPPVRSSAPSPSPAAPEFPSAFSSVHTQRSFIRDTRNTPPSNRPATPLSAAEQAHFNKLQGTFGARMLAKMGWQAGTGLGTTGEGIVTPVDQKQRPQKIGIAYKGFKEKTEQSKAEARRRGEVVSDDEGERRTKRGAKKAEKEQENRSDVWKRPKKVKTKVEHKTYEQIVAEAGQETSSAGIGVIIDATGATVWTYTIYFLQPD
jgi:tuftelin-interacting protein 11